MRITENEFESIPYEELPHVYKWGILTSINVDKDFFNNHFRVIFFLGYFYLRFEYKKELIYHKFDNLKSIKEYIKLKWAVIYLNTKALKEIITDNEVHASIDDHWALKESFSRNNEEFVSLLSHRTRLDNNSMDALTKYILEKWKT